MSPVGAVKFALFDLDGTLSDERAAFHRAIQTVLKRRDDLSDLADALPFTLEQVVKDEWRKLSLRYLNLRENVGVGASKAFSAPYSSLTELATPALTDQSRAFISDLPEFRTRVWADAIREHGRFISDHDSRELAIEVARERLSPEGGVAVPGAIETLKQLRSKGIKTVLLTNGNPDLQRHVARQIGITSELDAIVTSGEVGVRKPHPFIFLYALAKADGVAGEVLKQFRDTYGEYPAELQKRCIEAAKSTVMVGDDYAADIEGALNAGIPLKLCFYVPDYGLKPLREQVVMCQSVQLRDIPGKLAALDRDVNAQHL